MKRNSSLATLLVLSLVPAAARSATLVPSTVGPGDAYHLLFVTAGVTDATADEIRFYNDFVQAEAAESSMLTRPDGGIVWKAVVSTRDVDARDNAQVEAPIYTLDGRMAAAGFDELWSRGLRVPVVLDQHGNDRRGSTWTGTGLFGRARRPLGGQDPNLGITHGLPALEQAWVNSFFTDEAQALYPLFALSSKIQLPVPEPSCLLLLSLAIGFVVMSWRRQRTAAVQS